MDFERHRKRNVMGMIASATDLDESGIEVDAYRAYLASVQGVCALLGGGLSSKSDRSQMIALARQCLERIQHISDRFSHQKLPPDPESPTPGAAAAVAVAADVAGLMHQPGAAPAAKPFDPSEFAWSTYRNASICESAELLEPTEPSAPPVNDAASIGGNRLVFNSDSENEDPDPDRLSSFEDDDLVVVPTPTTRSAGKRQSPERQEGRPSQEEEAFDYGIEIHRDRLPIAKPVDELDPRQELSPLDEARRENERLVASYAIRMQRSPKHVQHNLSLELQRRLTENRQIAAVKHQAWLQRRHESREHFLQLAKRVFPEPSGGQTTPEYMQKQTTLADILQFEQTHPWTRQLRESLDANPCSGRAIENALLHMLLEKSHPLSKLRQRLQYSLFCKLNPLVEQNAHLLDAVRVPTWSPSPSPPPSPPPTRSQPAGTSLWPELPTEDGAEGERRPADAADSARERDQQDEAFRRHLRNVISDTQESEQLLVILAGAVHPSLSSAPSRPVVQRVLFTPLWPHLLVLFRLANRHQERRLAASLTRLRASGSHAAPAQRPRQLLRRLLLATSPADKCRLLVELVRVLCDTAEGPAGADVLLPLITALVVHSAAPQLLSELQFISEFMSDGSFQGEQGYCLTTLQTALLYLAQQQQ